MKMFNKKKCKKCGEKIGKDHSFCPYCGNPTSFSNFKEDFSEEEWGMLGKEDRIDPFTTEVSLPFGFNALFNTLVKSLDSQFKELDKELGRKTNFNEKPTNKNNILKKSGGISISISSFGSKPPEIKVHSFGNIPEFKQGEMQLRKQVKKQRTNISEENLKKLSTLPREEPSTNIRRLSNKVIYEIDIPGVKKIEDVSIIQLENSIEIKAISKDKAYFKLIPINMPIIDQKLAKGKLILELSDTE